MKSSHKRDKANIDDESVIFVNKYIDQNSLINNNLNIDFDFDIYDDLDEFDIIPGYNTVNEIYNETRQELDYNTVNQNLDQSTENPANLSQIIRVFYHPEIIILIFSWILLKVIWMKSSKKNTESMTDYISTFKKYQDVYYYLIIIIFSIIIIMSVMSFLSNIIKMMFSSLVLILEILILSMIIFPTKISIHLMKSVIIKLMQTTWNALNDRYSRKMRSVPFMNSHLNKSCSQSRSPSMDDMSYGESDIGYGYHCKSHTHMI
ncbi:TPA_asm: G [Dryobalanops betacytorhabdovirus 1]|nr:TPA_asm: G [Dryobalanops betacytorhabdovirus 1]